MESGCNDHSPIWEYWVLVNPRVCKTPASAVAVQFCLLPHKYGDIAQLVEHLTVNQKVIGSRPIIPA